MAQHNDIDREGRIGPFLARYMPKQWLCRVEKDGRAFNVYETGEQGWVLFKPLIPGTNSEGTIDIPIKRKELRIRLPRP